ncbi:NAD(P)-binding protein [Staphylococcus argenteus]|uniref:NAD(P)-binding protein n=1 Tax=Staphylococcus argenteus TaxID=985002 RepID=UPI001EFE8638|nr:NAD(P)-binding protein [Staphylococcus argenteus]MCG9811670.1 NAD(P)-binding protein [Staphylococcus argenteus]
MNMPLMIDLTNKKVVIVGGGAVASRRAQVLSQYIESMTVVSPNITKDLQKLVEEGIVIWIEKSFEPNDIADAHFIIAATNDPKVNEVVKQAVPKHALFNHAGNALDGNVVFPSTFRRDRLTISVSSDGASPKLTKQIMLELEKLYPLSYSSYVHFLYVCRKKIKVLDIPQSEKQRLLSKIVSKEYLDHDKQIQFLAEINEN